MKNLSLIVLAALVAGIVVGALVRGADNAALASAAGVVEAFGGLWLNALRMTVVPLVASLIVVGVASVADISRTGGLVARAVLLFSVLVLLAALYGILATNGLIALWPVAEADAEFPTAWRGRRQDRGRAQLRGMAARACAGQPDPRRGRGCDPAARHLRAFLRLRRNAP